MSVSKATTGLGVLAVVIGGAVGGEMGGAPGLIAVGMTQLAPLAINAPEGVLVEAERHAASDSATVEDPLASGGKAVANQKAWQPLVSIDVPAGEAKDRLFVVVRHKGGPFQLKALTDAGQSEKDWVWAKPQEWTWSRLGPYSRADLGKSVLLMRGEDAAAVSVDAVVFAPEGKGNVGAVAMAAAKELPPERPEATVAAVAAQVPINWAKKVGVVTPLLWGINDYEVKDAETARDPVFNSLMARLDAPIIRVHHASLPANWLAADGKRFDAEKIKASFAGVGVGYGKAKVMMCIAAWPERMTDPANPGVLSTSQEDEFAAYCVDLMRVMRDVVKRPVDYWEITNERDGTYEKLGKLDDLWRQYNKAYDAMKAFDPKAKVGGPALTWAKPVWVEGFTKACVAKGKADFVSYHNYGIGDVYDSNATLMSRLEAFSEHAVAIRKAVDAAIGSGRRVPIFCDEYNVKWDWNPIDRRQGNSVGAAFQAGVLSRLAAAGIDGAMVWHAKGDVYGIFGGDNSVRATAPLYFWGHRHLVGDLMAVESETKGLEIIATAGGDGVRSVMIANTTDHSMTIGSPAQLLGDAPKVYISRVDADGTHTLNATSPAATTLPGYSVTLISTKVIAGTP